MKKLCILACAAMVVACTPNQQPENPFEQQDVQVSFAPVRAPMGDEQTATLADFCTRLDVWIIQGGETIAVHQSSTDADFGTINLTLNRLNTYTMHAVGHKGNGEATLTNNVLTFPDDKVTHTLVGSTTFSPATTSAVNLNMQRVVGQFRLEIADVIPDNVAKFDIEIAQTGTRWNLSTNEAVNIIDRSTTINLTSRTPSGGANLSVYVLPNDLSQAYGYDIHVAAKTSGNVLVEERTFEDVQIQAGYKTTYTGQFFVATPMSFSFAVSDWQSFDPVEF